MTSAHHGQGLLVLSREFPPGPGGIGNHAFNLAKGLQYSGWDVQVLAPQDYADDKQILDFDSSLPFQIRSLASGRGVLREGFQRFEVVKGHIKREKPAVALVSGERMVWLAAALGRAMPPWVAVGHGTEFGSRGIRGSLTKFAFSRAPAVVYVSRFTQQLAKKMGVRPKLEAVIPNGADHTIFACNPDESIAVQRREAGIGDRPVLLTVGNVTQRKGQEIVVRALAKVRQVVPNVLYVMIGLPTERERLERVASNFGVLQNIRFLGRVGESELVGFLNLSDIFIMTSLTTPDGDCEGFGIAVVEAALCGKPAVVAGGSGLVEAIEPGVTGVVVPQGDVNATAEAMLRLLQDAPRRGEMGRAAERRALREQTWEYRAGQYDSVLRKLLGESSLKAGKGLVLP